MLLSVIMPALNEAAGIQTAVRSAYAQRQACADLGLDLEVLVVDNNSTDNTAALAASAGARVVHEPRRGYGCAHKTGLAFARGDVLVAMDADCSYPPEAIPTLARLIIHEGYQFVTTDRLHGKGDGLLPSHRAANIAFTWLARILLGARLADTQSGMWALHRCMLRHLYGGGLGDGMEFSQQIKFICCRTGIWTEVPIHYRPRVGEAKLRPVRDGLRNLAYLILGTMRRPPQRGGHHHATATLPVHSTRSNDYGNGGYTQTP